VALRRIAVLRALPGLGDLLCAVPALRAVRAAHPEAHVSLIGLPGAAWFVDRFAGYVDELLPLTAWPGLPETPGPIAEADAFVVAARRRRFDLALQLHGDGTITNDLIDRLGAAERAGMSRAGAWRPSGRFVDITDDMNEAERLLAVVRAAGMATPSRPCLEWPETGADVASLDGVLPRRPFAVIHPGASLPSRRWDPLGFAAVGDHLADRGLDVVLTGVAGERPITAAVRSAMTAAATDLAGATPLGATAALVRRADRVVTNDTGMSHLAAAVGTPSVVVFTATDPRRWKPAPDRHHAVIAGALGPTIERVLTQLVA